MPRALRRWLTLSALAAGVTLAEEVASTRRGVALAQLEDERRAGARPERIEALRWRAALWTAGFDVLIVLDTMLVVSNPTVIPAVAAASVAGSRWATR